MQETFWERKGTQEHRQDGQREGSLPLLSATASERAMPPVGRGEKLSEIK